MWEKSRNWGGGKIDMKMKTNGSSSLELARRLLVRGIQVDIPEDDPHASSVLLQGVLIRQTGADFQSTVRFRNSTSTARASRQRSRSVIRTAKSRRFPSGRTAAHDVRAAPKLKPILECRDPVP